MKPGEWVKSSFSYHSGNCAEVQWRKSGASTANGQCAEAGECPHGDWLVRDSKDPDGPVLRFTAAEWDAFRSGVKAGEFDDPAAR